jgi:hypothetical protein
MADFNIIYTAEDNQDYLWNGSGFDLVDNQDNEKLLYSGRSYSDKDLPGELQKVREAVKLSFPTDTNIRLKQVEVPVNNKSDSPGHTPHIIS